MSADPRAYLQAAATCHYGPRAAGSRCTAACRRAWHRYCGELALLARGVVVALALALALVSGCLVSNVDGDPRAPGVPELGEVVSCAVARTCDGTTEILPRVRVCSTDLDVTENEIAHACRVASCGFCTVACLGERTPCVILPPGDP